MNNSLFLIPPEEKYLCCNHGGIMSTPVVNVECGHMFCPSCIESISNCPIDHMPIMTVDINFQLKSDIDQLLCYCKFGVMEANGEIITNPNGCGSVICYGNKSSHEESCRYNPVNQTQVDEDGFIVCNHSRNNSCTGSIPQDSPTFSSPSYQSINSSPFVHSNSQTPNSQSSIKKDNPPIKPLDISGINNNSKITPSTSSSSLSSSSRSSSNPPSPTRQPKQEVDNYNDDYEANQLWESSTNLFFCSRFCPNKEYGCFFYGKTAENIQDHLKFECPAQKMLNRIGQLESIIEQKDDELNTLKSNPTDNDPLIYKTNTNSTHTSKYTQSRQLAHGDSFVNIIAFIFQSIRKSIVRGFQRLKKIFQSNKKGSKRF